MTRNYVEKEVGKGMRNCGALLPFSRKSSFFHDICEMFYVELWFGVLVNLNCILSLVNVVIGPNLDELSRHICAKKRSGV